MKVTAAMCYLAADNDTYYLTLVIAIARYYQATQQQAEEWFYLRARYLAEGPWAN